MYQSDKIIVSLVLKRRSRGSDEGGDDGKAHL